MLTRTSDKVFQRPTLERPANPTYSPKNVGKIKNIEKITPPSKTLLPQQKHTIFWKKKTSLILGFGLFGLFLMFFCVVFVLWLKSYSFNYSVSPEQSRPESPETKSSLNNDLEPRLFRPRRSSNVPQTTSQIQIEC